MRRKICCSIESERHAPWLGNYSSMIWIYLIVIIVKAHKMSCDAFAFCIHFYILVCVRRTINHCEKERKIVCFVRLNFSLVFAFVYLVCAHHPNFLLYVTSTHADSPMALCKRFDRSKLNLVNLLLRKKYPLLLRSGLLFVWRRCGQGVWFIATV